MTSPNPRNPLHLIAFGFGAGFSPAAPGTVGTLVGVPIFLLLAQLPLSIYLMVVASLFALGVPLCQRVSDDLGQHDHGGIVWDEIVGYLVAMAGMPSDLNVVLAGFFLFRFFDIVKPWPIAWLDRRVGGGLGIMLDDLVAGVFAAVSLYLLSLAGFF